MNRIKGFSGDWDGTDYACNAGDPGSVSGSGRSTGKGNGYSLQYSCLEKFRDRGAWWTTVHGVTKSWMWLSDYHSVQFSSVSQSCLTLCNPMNCSTPGLPVYHRLPESINSVMASNHFILRHPLLLPPSIIPSIRVFSSESVLHIRWPKYWSFSFNISPSNENSGLISFRMDWLDLLAVQGTLKSLLQHHSSKASVLQHSAFFTVQLSHPYMTTGKIIALTRRTFVGKVMSLLFNMLSRLVPFT